MPPTPTTGMLTGTGGVATNISDHLRPQTVLKVGNNVNQIVRGVITNRYSGWLRQRAGNFNSGAQFLDFANFTANAGTQTLIFQCGGSVYSYDLVTETAIVSGLDATRPPCMRMFAPYISGTAFLVYCNGIDQPRKITGTGAGAVALLQLNGGNYPQATAAPLPVKTYSKPKFCEPFRDRMIIAGFDGSGGNNTEYDVLITNSGTAETVTQSAPLVATNGGMFQVDANLGAITGIKAFKLTNASNDTVCLVAQEKGVSLITGKDATDFAMFTLTDEYGVPSNRTWIRINNDMYFWATDGLRRFSTLVENANLLNAALTFPLQDLVNRVTTGSMLWAHASHMKLYQEVQFWFPTDGSTQCDHCIIVNYNTGSESPEEINPIFFTKDGTALSCSTVFKNVFYGGGYGGGGAANGLLQTHYTGHLYDTTPVQSEVAPALIKPETPEAICSLERVTILTEGGSQKFLANAYPYARVGNSLVRKQGNPVDYVISAPASSGTALGTWPLGTGAMPANHVKQHYFEPGQQGQLHEISLKATMADHEFDWLACGYRINQGGLHS